MRQPADELEELRSQALLRQLRPLDSPQSPQMRLGANELLNFSSNDYLGLANSEFLREALKAAVDRHGAGSGAARLVCGTLAPHAALEEALAAFKGTEAALTFSSGYAAAVGAVTALVGKGDVVILDKLCHASLVDGARLSGATLRVFPHHNVEKLAHLLKWARAQVTTRGRILVVTESVYSMDGDVAPLAEMVRLKDEAGAWLLLDEAHAVGVLGSCGRGWAEACGVSPHIDVHLGTLSKAVGLSGGYVCGSRPIIDLLLNKARSFIYSTAPPPALAEAAQRVVTEMFLSDTGEQLRAALWRNIHELASARPDLGFSSPQSAILPLRVGEESAAVERSEVLRQAGFLVPAIRFPTVARGQARLRITLSASHTSVQIQALAGALASAGEKR